MLRGYFPKITLPSGKSDVRKGDGLAIICSGQAMLIDAFIGGEPTDRLKAWLMKNIKPNENGTYVIDIAVISHPHDDHYGGVGLIADDNRFWIRMIICYDPDSLAFGVDSSMNGQALKKDIAAFKSFLSHMKSKGTAVVYKDKGDTFEFRDITWEIWRKQPTKFTSLDGGEAWAFVNDGSLALYSPETGLAYGGDGSDAIKEAIKQAGWKISGMPVPHHGNSEEKSAAVAIKGSGCVMQWQSCIERKGAGSTSWTTYGSQRALQQGIPVWQQDEDIYITAEGGQITFKQGSKTITKAIPYAEWTHDEKGWKCGDYTEGWQEISGRWYFFADGYTKTGFFNPQGNPDKIYRYLDPGSRGAMTISSWFQDEEKSWYYADGFGRILTGWRCEEGKWYYLTPWKNGAMAQDMIVKDYNGSYYMDGWGIMRTNCIVKHDGHQYYCNEYGVIQTGQWLQFGGKWYSADETGAFRVGWYDDPELGRRYLEPAMVTSSFRTVDGKTYSFDGYGRVSEGITGLTKVVDVSEFNPKSIDWTKVREAGYGAILRIGIRGSVKSNQEYYGKIRYDKNYSTYLDGVIKAGVPYGVYFFPTSISEKEAQEEAAWLIANVAGLPMSFPVFLDSEMVDGGKGRADGLGKADRTKYLRIISDTLMNNGIQCGIYASTSWLNSKLDMLQFSEGVRKNTWVAQYNDKCTYTGEYMMWQYSSKGSVPGISGNVDVSRITSKPIEVQLEDSGKSTRGRIVSLAQSLVGTQEGTSAHHKIIDGYNARKPLPRGYAVKYSDAWCATFCSYLAIASGYTEIIPIECGCPQWVTLAKGMGIWIESDSFTPKPGDFILYDWQDSGSGDNTGTPDHIGIVEKVASGKITVIEGNYSDMVKRRTIAVNGNNIRGFVTPKYSD